MIFVDSGAVYAIFDKKDINHEMAAEYFKANSSKLPLIIITPVFIECWFLLDSRLGKYYADKFLDAVQSNIFSLKEITYLDFLSARDIEKKYKDIDFGLVDCLSFAYIERNKINTVFTFDRKHFNIYRPENFKILNIVPC